MQQNKILILNSDSPKNRGDRPILMGNIILIKKRFPDAQIHSLSQFPNRDKDWFGIEFLPFSPLSVNPLDFIRLFVFARSSSWIFWGGGEILKDYTNKAGVLYWFVKIGIISTANNNIYGMFQGIGPTSSKFCKRLIGILASRMKVFFVRDSMSKAKLEKWGCKSKIVSSYDPAILCSPKRITKVDLQLIETEFCNQIKISDDFIGIGLRSWFHYKKHSWLPYSYTSFLRSELPESKEFMQYINNVSDFCDYLVEKYKMNLVFFPMHMSKSENDALFSKRVISKMRHKSRCEVIDSDTISPQMYLNLIARSKYFVGSRLHSTILSTIWLLAPSAVPLLA